MPTPHWLVIRKYNFNKKYVHNNCNKTLFNTKIIQVCTCINAVFLL